jgi:hypothetical protein
MHKVNTRDRDFHAFVVHGVRIVLTSPLAVLFVTIGADGAAVLSRSDNRAPAHLSITSLAVATAPIVGMAAMGALQGWKENRRLRKHVLLVCTHTLLFGSTDQASPARLEVCQTPRSHAFDALCAAVCCLLGSP